MQVTELALYDVTESFPIQILSHSSVYLVNLHVNIKTLWANVTLLAKWASECIDCAFRAYSISVEHVDHTNYTNCGGGA